MRSAALCPQDRISLNPQPAKDLERRTTPALAPRLGRVARRWWRAYWNWRARQATVLILQSLDRRTLHDIGINPSEIESCVYGRRGDRRRAYDASWPWRTGA